ncbi:MAG TPA: ERCC4 domain-containing protein [Candidatus Binataceae bacterium]|nr:ERCC4 domain-containing protein [Candidatus Binataceae bacterium]
MPRAPKPRLTFLYDTREKTPWHFGAVLKRDIFADGGSREVTLGKEFGGGDYSVEIDGGGPLPIAIERKSHIDLLGCIGHDRARFERELERLAERMERAMIIVEATLDDLLRGQPRSQISPKAAVASLAKWHMEYGVATIFGENHRRAGGYAQRLLEQYAAWKVATR